MSNKNWQVVGSVNVTGLAPIKLDQTTAQVNDQNEIRTYRNTLTPSESFTPDLTAFAAVRSIVFTSDQPVSVTINGGPPRPNVRMVIEWASTSGSLLSGITVQNPPTALVNAEITLVLGGDGV